MLSDSNIAKINKAIAKELETVTAWLSTAEDKSNAIARATQLKSLLAPEPTQDELLAKLAEAITSHQTPTPSAPTPSATIIADLVNLLNKK